MRESSFYEKGGNSKSILSTAANRGRVTVSEAQKNGQEVRIFQKFQMPVLFLAHGSPMLALARPEEDVYVAMLQKLSQRIPQPKAILNIGAHFYGPGKWLDVSSFPKTLYDFFGFPQELSQIIYPAPGFMEGIQLIQDIFPDNSYQLVQRGLDHGTWTVLKHVFPQANIPVFALSLDSRDSYEDALELGRKLRDLRTKGVLIVANGNIVHNLSDVAWGSSENFAHTYAKEFDTTFIEAWNSKDIDTLCAPHSMIGGARSVPTPEHYIPALVAFGASFPDETTTVLFDGYELGSIGRRSLGMGM